MRAATCCRSNSTSRDRDVRRRHGLQGRRRSQAHAHRPGDHLRRHERRQPAASGGARTRARPGRMMLAGQATDVVLDPDSGTVLNPDTDTTVQGNLQVVYAGIRGVGVFMSPNQGQVWNLMTGGVGNPLIVNDFNAPATNVNPATGPTPNGAEGRIVLAVPNATGNAAEDADLRRLALRGRRHPRRRLRRALRHQGLRPELDRGPHPHRAATRATRRNPAIPTNDVSQPNYPIIGQRHVPARAITTSPGRRPDQSQRRLPGRQRRRQPDRTDPRRPDRHLGCPLPGRLFRRFANDGGTLNLTSTGPATVDQPERIPSTGLIGSSPTSYLNFIRNPEDPFVANATLDVFNYAQLHQQRRRRRRGSRSTSGGTDYHRIVTMIDPTTGLPRLIFGNDQGVWSVLDNNGTFETQIGARSDRRCAGISRNGNLQITQFYYGAAQPSTAAALIAGALFYGSAQDNGGPVSDPNIISNGDIAWSGPGGDASGVATDQQGTGTALPVLLALLRRRTTPTSSRSTASAETFGLLQASGGHPDPRPAVAVHGRRQLRRQPGQRPGRRHQLGRRPDLRHHERGRDLVRRRRPGGLRQPRQLQRRPGLRRARPDGPRGRRQPGQLHLRRHRDRTDLRHPGRRRQRRQQQLDQHLRRPGWLGRRVDHHRPDPRQPRRLRRHHQRRVTSSPTRSPRRAIPPTPTSGSTSPATSRPWRTPSSARATTRRPTRNSTTYDQAVTLSSIVGRLAIRHPQRPPDPTAGYHPVLYVGADSGVFQSTRQRPDVDALPRHDLRRGGGGGLSAACRPSPP